MRPGTCDRATASADLGSVFVRARPLTCSRSPISSSERTSSSFLPAHTSLASELHCSLSARSCSGLRFGSLWSCTRVHADSVVYVFRMFARRIYRRACFTCLVIQSRVLLSSRSEGSSDGRDVNADVVHSEQQEHDLDRARRTFLFILARP